MTFPLWLLPLVYVVGLAGGLAFGWIALRLTEPRP